MEFVVNMMLHYIIRFLYMEAPRTPETMTPVQAGIIFLTSLLCSSTTTIVWTKAIAQRKMPVSYS